MSVAASYTARADDLVVTDDGLSAGYVTLAWPDIAGSSFRLERQDGDHWTVLYDGPDRASTLSGLANGTYHFRLEADGGAPGPALAVTVKHHPLSRAWSFFGAGAVMFACLIGLLFVGTRRPLPEGFDLPPSDDEDPR